MSLGLVLKKHKCHHLFYIYTIEYWKVATDFEKRNYIKKITIWPKTTKLKSGKQYWYEYILSDVPVSCNVTFDVVLTIIIWYSFRKCWSMSDVTPTTKTGLVQMYQTFLQR